MQLLEVEFREPRRSPTQRGQVLRPAGVAGRVVRPEPAEPEQLAGELAPGAHGFDTGEDASRPGLGRPRADRPAQARLTPDPCDLPVAAARVGGDALGLEIGHHIELVLAHHLDDRDVLLAERMPLRPLPRGLVAERPVRAMLDLGRVDAVVLVDDVDCQGAAR